MNRNRLANGSEIEAAERAEDTVAPLAARRSSGRGGMRCAVPPYACLCRLCGCLVSNRLSILPIRTTTPNRRSIHSGRSANGWGLHRLRPEQLQPEWYAPKTLRRWNRVTSMSIIRPSKPLPRSAFPSLCRIVAPGSGQYYGEAPLYLSASAIFLNGTPGISGTVSTEFCTVGSSTNCNNVSAVPLPAAFPLFASAPAGLGGSGWWKRGGRFQAGGNSGEYLSRPDRNFGYEHPCSGIRNSVFQKGCNERLKHRPRIRGWPDNQTVKDSGKIQSGKSRTSRHIKRYFVNRLR
jgi:hypothetical protein